MLKKSVFIPVPGFHNPTSRTSPVLKTLSKRRLELCIFFFVELHIYIISKRWRVVFIDIIVIMLILSYINIVVWTIWSIQCTSPFNLVSNWVHLIHSVYFNLLSTRSILVPFVHSFTHSISVHFSLFRSIPSSSIHFSPFHPFHSILFTLVHLFPFWCWFGWRGYFFANFRFLWMIRPN